MSETHPKTINPILQKKKKLSSNIAFKKKVYLTRAVKIIQFLVCLVFSYKIQLHSNFINVINFYGWGVVLLNETDCKMKWPKGGGGWEMVVKQKIRQTCCLRWRATWSAKSHPVNLKCLPPYTLPHSLIGITWAKPESCFNFPVVRSIPLLTKPKHGRLWNDHPFEGKYWPLAQRSRNRLLLLCHPARCNVTSYTADLIKLFQCLFSFPEVFSQQVKSILTYLVSSIARMQWYEYRMKPKWPKCQTRI